VKPVVSTTGDLIYLNHAVLDLTPERGRILHEQVKFFRCVDQDVDGNPEIEQIKKFRAAFNERHVRLLYNDNINVGPVAAFAIGYRPEEKGLLDIMLRQLLAQKGDDLVPAEICDRDRRAA